MEKQKIKIDIFSDINCPWCYVGERRLKKAIESVEGTYDFDLNFKAYELNANIPQEGISRLDYFKKNFGEQKMAQIPMMDKHLTDTGAAEGIAFDFSDDMSVNNTFNGHRPQRPAHRIRRPARSAGDR